MSWAIASTSQTRSRGSDVPVVIERHPCDSNHGDLNDRDLVARQARRNYRDVSSWEWRVMAERKPGRGSDQFPLRLPDGMRGRLKALADRNGRSMNAEIVSRLEDSL